MTARLFRSGRIRPSFDGAAAVDALGVRDGRVVALGAEADVRAALGPADEVIDLGGAWVVPGLVDTHPHLLHFGVAAAGLADLAGVVDHAAIVAEIAQRRQRPATRPVGHGHPGRRAPLLLPARLPGPG